MVKFLSITLENFLSYSQAEFNFTPSTYLVTGENQDSSTEQSNGSGKSSLFEAITFALFGKSTRPVIKDGEEDFKVNLSFTVGSHTYVVSRTNTSLNLLCDSADISNKGKKSTQETINSLIGISPDIFLQSIIIKSSVNSYFSHFTPVQRKSILEEFVATNWDALTSKFKTSFFEIDREYLTYVSQVQEAGSKLSSVKTKKHTKEEEYEKNLKAISTSNETDTNLLKVQRGAYEMSLKDLSPTLQEDYSNLNKQRNSKQRDKENIEFIINKDKCPTCLKPVTDSDKEMAKTSSLEMGRELKRLDEEIFVLKKTLSEKEKILISMRELDVKLSIKPVTIPKPDLFHMEQEVLSIETTLTELAGKRDSLQGVLEDYKFIFECLRPKSKFRTFVLHNFITIINQILRETSQTILQDTIIQFVPTPNDDGTDIQILKNNQALSVNRLSSGERKKVDLIILFSLQKYLVMYSQNTFNILVFDEVFDGIDEEGVISIIRLIPSIFPDELCLYIITHNERLKDCFSNYIHVVKNKGCSTLSVGG